MKPAMSTNLALVVQIQMDTNMFFIVIQSPLGKLMQGLLHETPMVIKVIVLIAAPWTKAQLHEYTPKEHSVADLSRKDEAIPR